MIDSEQLLVRVCGSRKVASFKDVKRTSMRLAKVVREVVAEELQGDLPASGKQFLQTPRGTWRLASRGNSDNTTEDQAHRRMGAISVQVFGDLSPLRRQRGWISVAKLYEIHGVTFNGVRLESKVAARLRQTRER